jgi:hypothetical protein
MFGCFRKYKTKFGKDARECKIKWVKLRIDVGVIVVFEWIKSQFKKIIIIK